MATSTIRDASGNLVSVELPPAVDNNRLPVVPGYSSGGNASVQTSVAGTAYATFGAQACKRATVINNSGVTLLVQRGGAGVGVPIPTGQTATFEGIASLAELGIRREDGSTTQVYGYAIWAN